MLSTMSFTALAAQATEVDTVEELKAALAANQDIILTGDIDLNNEEWEPVNYGKHFDGGNYTISNLKINKPDTDNVGFITSLNGTFENVTFENVDVVGRENVGAIAGRAGGSAALAQNINVNGIIKVESTNNGYARVGVIVGGWAYGRYIDITVDGTNPEESYVKWTGSGDGRYAAGIVGHADDVKEYTNCTVKNLTISGGWLCGGITGPGPADGIVSGCSVENIKMNADYSGGMFGWYFGNGTVEDCEIKNVEFTDGGTANGTIGGYDTPSGVTVSNVTIENVVNYGGEPLMSYSVAIDDGTAQKCYPTLDDAIADAAGAEIVLLKDAELNTKLNNATININLNGYTMNVNVGANYIIGGNSISNGTIDISNASSSQNIFGLAQCATPATTLTMDNVTFIGDGFNSGYAVFEIGNSGAEVALNIIDSTINLKNDNADQGGFVKGYGANCVLEIINTDVTLDNTDMFGVNVAANIVDSKFVVNNLTDTAFRNFGGTIANSVISIDNSGNGIRNSGAEYDLAIENNSSVVISGSTNTEEGKIGDLVLAAGCTVDVDDTSELLVETSSIANGDDATGNVVPKADKVYVQFKEVATDADETKLYDIVLVGANAEKINELASADLTFEFNGIPAVGSKNINCEIAAKEGVMLTKLDNRYMFNCNGIDLHEETDNKIVIGTVTVTGYGTFTFKTSDVPTNAVYATEIRDSIVDEFKTAAATLVINEEMEASGEPDDGMVGKIESEIKVPTRKLTVNVDFPNAVVDNAVAYQDMKVEIAGNIDGKNQTVTYNLGTNENSMNSNGSYKVVEEKTVVNNKYTVTVSGAGYRTVSYTVTMDDNKTLNFWNNVKDDAQPVEEKKTTGFVNTTFLAGDIVKDANINIYDLSAVVAYFGTATNNDVKYSKYDLNRDGDIDSKDVAYVLVSWNN